MLRIWRAQRLTSFNDLAARFHVEIAGDESDIGEVQDLRSVRKCLCPARGKRVFRQPLAIGAAGRLHAAKEILNE